MKTVFFFFFVADHLLVGQLCTNPKSDRSLLLWLKVTQCSMSEIGDVPLYNHALCRSKLWQQDHCQHPQNANLDCQNNSDVPRVMKIVSGYGYGLWCGFKWGPHHATSHLRSRLESQHQSVPGCAEECGYPLLADPGCGSRTRHRPTSPKRPRLGFRKSTMTLYPSLTAPSSLDLNPLD